MWKCVAWDRCSHSAASRETGQMAELEIAKTSRVNVRWGSRNGSDQSVRCMPIERQISIAF
jgi:hypothetical protein